MTATFSALSDPMRRRILDLLLVRPRLVGELVDLLGISQPGVSKHLKVLRAVGLVSVRQDAQRHWYELRPEPLAEIDAWLEPYRELWEGRFDRLEAYIEAFKQQQALDDQQEPDQQEDEPDADE